MMTDHQYALIICFALLGVVMALIWYINVYLRVENYEESELNTNRVLDRMKSITHFETQYVPNNTGNNVVRRGGIHDAEENTCRPTKRFSNKFNKLYVNHIQPKTKDEPINMKSTINVGNLNADSIQLNDLDFVKSTNEGLVIGDQESVPLELVI